MSAGVEGVEGVEVSAAARWYRVGIGTTNCRVTAAMWAADRKGPGKVEVLADVIGPVLETYVYLGRRNGRRAWAVA